MVVNITETEQLTTNFFFFGGFFIANPFTNVLAHGLVVKASALWLADLCYDSIVESNQKT